MFNFTEEHHTNLRVTALDRRMHENTIGYWYTVTSNFSAHVAFKTKQGLMRWLNERGLELSADLPQNKGEWAGVEIVGSYVTRVSRDVEFFNNIPGVILETRQMSNGRYTLGKITEDDQGRRVVWYVNVNCHRIEYDYQESDELYN